MAVSSRVRGPDGVRFHLEAGAAFAHLAFHLTPESVRERQPLVSEDGRLILVADARLDNRADLVGQLLPDRPNEAPSPTDADLLLLAYQRWGERCPERLLGEFVFAVWNRSERQLFLARDPLGAYSLSYHQVGNRLVFASETAAILDLPGFSPLINELSVTRVLAGLAPCAEDSFFESILYLPPGHCLMARPAGNRRWRYWSPTPQHLRYRDEAQYVDHFLELLDQAIACRVRSVGAVGISLSGGNDSTLLAARTATLLPERIPAHPRLLSFSYVFDRHRACDEREYIDAVVSQYGLDASYLPSDEAWTFHALHQQPIARDCLWSNCYVQLPLAVARAAQAVGCRLLLDGHFGDTLLSGHSYYAADLLYRGQWRHLLALLGAEASPSERWRSLVHRGMRLLLPDWLRRAYRGLRPLPLEPFVRGLIRRRLEPLRTALRGEDPSSECARLPPSRRPRCRSLLSPAWPQGMAAVRGFLYARHGIEKISPYFDRRLVEYLLAIPQEQIATPGEPRRLQRAAMARVLPAKVWQRERKTSYEALLREGLVERERGTLNALLPGSRVCGDGWIDEAWLRGLLADPAPSDETLYVLSACGHLALWLAAVASTSRGDWSKPYFWGS